MTMKPITDPCFLSVDRFTSHAENIYHNWKPIEWLAKRHSFYCYKYIKKYIYCIGTIDLILLFLSLWLAPTNVTGQTNEDMLRKLRYDLSCPPENQTIVYK